jgi:hypothetical protein
MLAPPSSAPPVAADDRKVEAALAEHGGVLTRDDFAAALGWPLNRLERALLALASRLRPTGLRLHRVTWNSYALSPNLGVLSGEERRQLHQLHAVGVVTGYRSQDWLFRLPPEDRKGIELLVRQGLIQRDSRDVYWEPSPDVIDSLFLQREE